MLLRPTTCVFLLLAIGACATDPAGESRDVPDWVTGSPPESSSLVYFTGRGENGSGSQVRAEDDATAALVAEITRYLGVRVESETEAVARASLDDFENRVTQTVRQQSGARIEGLRITDRYVESDDGEVRVYLLAAYEREALEAERDRLAAVFEEEVDAVQGTAARATELAEQGERFEALRLHLRAAEAALESDLEFASRIARESAREAREIAEQLRMRRVAEDPMTVEVFSEHSSGRDPESGVDVLVRYPANGPNGRLTIRSSRAITDGRGRVSFSLPDDARQEEGSVHMIIDAQSMLSPLRGSEVADDIHAIAETLRNNRVRFDYSDVADGDERATDAPMISIVVVERNMDGDTIEEAGTAGALRGQLIDRGFRVAESAFAPGDAAGLSQRQIVASAREALPVVDLILSAEVAVTEVADSADAVVRVDGTFTLIDADSAAAVASWTGFLRSPGSSVPAAANAAFRRLGRRAAQELSRRVP